MKHESVTFNAVGVEHTVPVLSTSIELLAGDVQANGLVTRVQKARFLKKSPTQWGFFGFWVFFGQGGKNR